MITPPTTVPKTESSPPRMTTGKTRMAKNSRSRLVPLFRLARRTRPTAPEDDPLHDHPEEDPARDADEDGQRPRQAPGDVGVVDDEGPDDQELTLGEIDDLGGLVDEDEPEGGEGEDGAVGQAVDGERQKP